MRRSVRVIVILAVLCSAAALLAGCGPDRAATGGDTGAATAIDQGTSAFTKDTVILTVGGSPVYWPEFQYWLKFITDYYKKQNQLQAITDWSAQQNGKPLDQFLLSSAVDYAGRQRAVEAKAAEMGVQASTDQQAQTAKTRADNVSIYGSETEYQRIVSQMYVSEDVYNYLVKIGYLSTGLFAQLYGPRGEKCTDQDVAAYVADKHFMCARYVFLSNTANGGAQLTDPERLKNQGTLEELIGRLKTGSDPVSLFADLVGQYNQDTAAASYPDGVLFAPGTMPAEFESAYAELKDGEYSGVVQTAAGLYVLMRLPIRPDMVADPAGDTLRYRTAYEYLFENQVNNWYAGMKVTYTKAYSQIDLRELFK